jgi:PPOX class probable F420-dependent enzyme
MSKHFALLDRHQYMNLTTYRKDGTEVSRPVWFAEQDDKLYIVTEAQSGKAKHIRRNGDVFVSPSDYAGNPLSDERTAGTASLHEKNTAVMQTASKLLNRKYRPISWLFQLRWFFNRNETVWIEIVPRTEQA